MLTRKLNPSVSKGISLSIVMALSVLSILIMSSRWSARIYSNDYLASLIDKDELLKNLGGPRLIFVGGSNLGFGLDSEYIEGMTHLPVINCGIHAGLGLSFILNNVKTYLKEGDIVVLSTEYEITLQGDPQVLSVVERAYPKSSTYALDQQDWRTLVRKACINTQDSLRNLGKLLFAHKSQSSCYFRDKFNRYGDFVGHLGLAPQKFAKGGLSGIGDHSEIIHALNEFASFAKVRGAKVCFIYPPIAAGSFYAQKSAYEDFQNQMTNKLNTPILSEPEDFVFTDNLFFDTHYHLNREGRQMRTEKLVRHLLRYLMVGRA